jgi:hypothetical protein
MFISIYLYDVFLQFSERYVVVQHFKMGGRFFSPNGISNGEVSFIKFCSVTDPGFEFFLSRIWIRNTEIMRTGTRFLFFLKEQSCVMKDTYCLRVSKIESALVYNVFDNCTHLHFTVPSAPI